MQPTARAGVALRQCRQSLADAWQLPNWPAIAVIPGIVQARLTPHPLAPPSVQMKDWLMEHGHEADVWALVQVRSRVLLPC